MSPTKKQVSKSTSETSKEHMMLSRGPGSRQDLTGNDPDWLRGKILLKPEDQLPLSEPELQEEFARVLSTHRTRVPDSLVEWSYKMKEFVKISDPPDLTNIINVPGTVLLQDSEEAKIQLTGGILVDNQDENEIVLRNDDDGEGEEEEEEEEEEAEYEEDEGEISGESIKEAGVLTEQQEEHEPEPEQDEEELEKAKPKKIPNQFNFCERAALTYSYPVRDATTQTVPPPTGTFNAHVLQWTIFDEYQEDYMKQRREREKEKKGAAVQPKKDDQRTKSLKESTALTNRMFQAAKTLERMVNQNIYDEIAQDYRYWDDPSDEFKDGEGSLLPLWKFSYDKTRKHDVTDICFNHKYYDLFAISFGTMAFNSSISNGTVCLFSLKNPSYPEWICSTESPVMCLDFSELHPHLLVIGTMDGTVAVYDVTFPPAEPQYKSNDVGQKHRGIVWEVRWAPDTEEGQLTFYSVSIDGKINHWVLNQNDLGLTTVMTLFLDQAPIPGPDGTSIVLKGCGTCFAFHPADSNIFLVGTEEGTIYKCNTAYSSTYIEVYKEAHNMIVYRLVFNKYNSNIFASCSGDWRIKIWEDSRLEPLFMFDLGVPIGDVQWAPYSSTVLACVSNDGKVTVFDLNVNKYRPICSQSIVSKKKSKLTRLAFNSILPFIIVGDDKGTVNTLKLSPNLRIKLKPTKKQMHLSQTELEFMKLEKLLSFVREPPILTPPEDVREVT